MRSPVTFDDERGPRAPSTCMKFSKCLLTTLNLLILILGLAVIIVIIILVNDASGGEKDTIIVNSSTETKGKQILEHCTLCRNTMIAALVLFSFVILSALCGFVALCTRNGCLLVTYAVFGFMLLTLMGVITAGLAMMKGGVFDDSFKYDWDSIDSLGKCRLETTFECSGWDTLCPGNYSVPNTTTIFTSTTAMAVSTSPLSIDVSTASTSISIPSTTFSLTSFGTQSRATHANASSFAGDNTTNQPNYIPIGCADCGDNDNAIIGNYSQTCDQMFSNAFEDAFVPMVSISTAFIFIGFVVMVVACRVRADAVKRDEDVALLNERYL